MRTRVAPNIENTLELIQPLPLMHSRKAAIIAKQSLGCHRIHVPSNQGGRLEIGLGATSKPASIADWRDDVSLKVMDPQGVFHRLDDPMQPLRLDVTTGALGTGNYYVYVHAPASHYQLYALLADTGQARNPDGTPFIPWNFWFFPYSSAEPNETAWAGAMKPLEKYEEAFGRTGAVLWERENHSDLHGSRDAWEGHCDDAAPASVLYEPPPAEGLTYNGVHFTCEELKLLAAEVAGQYKEPGKDWLINESKSRGGPYQDRKPSDAPADFGSIPGAGLAELLNFLRAQLRDAGRPVVMDLRDRGGVTPHSVWNHAVFRYRTELWQPDALDPTLMEGKTTLYANNDTLPPDLSCSGFPADVDGNTNVNLKEDVEQRHLRYRVRFNRYGGIDRDSPDQLWRNVTTDAGVDVSAPRLAVTFTLGDARHPETPSGGNPRVLRGDVAKLLKERPQP